MKNLRTLTTAAALLPLLAVYFFSSVSADAAASLAEIRGEWTASISKKASDEIHITFHRRSENGGFNVSGEMFKASDLQGVSASQINGPTRADVNFSIVTDAGSFACDGMFREGRGTGFWTFAPGEAFRADMKNRGYGYLNDDELMRAALNRLSRKLIDDLKSAGYENVEFKELIHAAGNGVTGAYIREIKAAGFGDLTLRQISRAADNRVTAAYIRELRGAGFTATTIEQLSRAADNGVTTTYIREIQAVGFANLSLDQIAKAADEKVSAAFAREMKAVFPDVTLDQIVRLKDEAVTAAFVEELRGEGYTDVTPSLAIRAKDEDVDRDFIRRAKAQGYNVGLAEMIRLKDRGTVK